jgi:hypothetical protein
MTHPLLRAARKIPGVRDLVGHAMDAMAPEMDATGACIVTISTDSPPTMASLRRGLVAMESAGVRGAGHLQLLSGEVWPTVEPTVVVTLQRPTNELVEATASMLSELGWSGLVFVAADSPLLQRFSDWMGAGLVPGLLWNSPGKGVLVEELNHDLKAVGDAVGYTPRFVSFPAHVEPEWAGRTAFDCGVVGIGMGRGVAGPRFTNSLQPRIMWARDTNQTELVAWTCRDKEALAGFELGRFMGHVLPGGR